MMSYQLTEEKNNVDIKQTEISELKECLRKKDIENEHLKSKVVDFTMVKNLQVQVKELQSENEHLKSKVFDSQMCQNLQVQVKELQSENEHLKSKVFDSQMCQNLQVQVEKLKRVNESFNLSIEELYKVRAITEATLRERDALIFAHCKKIRLLEEQSELFYEVYYDFESEIVIDTQDNLEKEYGLLEKDKRMFLAKHEFLEKVSSSVQKEYNDLLASNDVLKQRLETKFKVLKQDHSLEKMFEMVEQEYESNISKISITSSTIENKNLELIKEIGDKVKRFDDEKKIQVAKKKVKIASENADLSSRGELIPSKIKMCYEVVLNFHNEFLVFLSFKRKGNDGLLQNKVFKHEEEVVINNTIRILPK
nr:hypothetical protein [Tanacetum cinerariifolium]